MAAAVPRTQPHRLSPAAPRLGRIAHTKEGKGLWAGG